MSAKVPPVIVVVAVPHTGGPVQLKSLIGSSGGNPQGAFFAIQNQSSLGGNNSQANISFQNSLSTDPAAPASATPTGANAYILPAGTAMNESVEGEALGQLWVYADAAGAYLAICGYAWSTGT